MSLRRQGVVLGGESIIIPLQGDIRSLDVVVNPAAGASALVEFAASDHFVGASKQVGVSQTAPLVTFTAPDRIILADFAAHGITQPGQVFEIVGSASNDGFYRVLEFITLQEARVLPIDGGMITEVDAPDVGVFSGPSGGAGSVWVPWSEGLVAIASQADVPASSTALMVTATAGDVEFVINGGKERAQAAEVAGNPPLGAREWDGASFNKHVGVISNVVDGRNGTLSFWFKKAAGDAGTLFQMTDRFDVVFADQFINFIVQQTGGGLPNQVVVSTGTTGWLPDVWNHYMVSWENTFPISTANVTQYLNGVELIDSVDSVAGFAGSLDVDLGYAGSNIWQGTDTLETDNLEICLSEFYLNLEDRVDLTLSANREQFRSPGGAAVNIGGNGSGPTGTQPAFYAANGELNANAGKSDSLSTVVGEILNCIDAPTKDNPPLGAKEWDRLTRNRSLAVLNGGADTRLGTVSFWIKIPTALADGVAESILISGITGNASKVFSIQRDGSGGNQRLSITLNIAGTPQIAITTPGSLALDTWIHFMASWENTFPVDSAAHVDAYVDDVAVVHGVGGGAILQFGFTDAPFGYLSEATEWSQGTNESFHDFLALDRRLEACLSEFYMNTDERIDLSIAANREQFISPTGDAVAIGGDGSGPSGNQPAFYASNGELNPNAGYAQNLPVVLGEVLNCIDAPVKSNPPLGAKEWDGGTYSRFTGVSGVADGRVGTCSFWMNVPDSTTPQGNVLLAAGNSPELGLILTYDSLNNQIVLLLKGVGSSNNRMTFISNKVVPDQWQHVMMSWEHTFPIDSAAHMTMYIDGVEITTGGGDTLDQLNIDEDLNYLTGSWTQGQSALGFTQNSDLNGCLSEFYFNTDERIDLTDAGNRAQFISVGGDAVAIGGDGSGPSGSQPAFYAADGDLTNNAGYVPNMSIVVGALLNCATAPTKVAPPPLFYVGLASDFNGAVLLEDTNGPLVSGQADGRLVTFSVWYKNNSDPSNDQEIIRIQNSVSQRAFSIRVSFPRGQALVASTAASTSNALVACSPATSSSQIADGWNHFMGSMEHLLPQNEVVNITAYFNGVLIVDGVSGAILDQQAFDFDIAYNSRGEEVVQGSNGFPTPGDFLDGCLSNLYVNIEERLDLTIQANREKFYSATGKNVFLGADGSLPTGTQPFIYAEDGDLRVNDGYGPSLALIQGVIAACSDRPPEG